MAEDIQKFDPATLMQGVKDRIKATFVSLIPDEQWDQMVKKEVESFFKERQNAYHNRNVSDFMFVVYEVLTQLSKERAKELFKSEEFQTHWDPDKQRETLSEMMHNKLINHAPEMFLATIEGAISRVLQEMRNKTY